MNAKQWSCGWLSMLAILAGPAASASEPLNVNLAPLAAAKAPVERPAAARPSANLSRRSFAAPQPEVLERDLRLTDRRHSRQDALASIGVVLLAAPDATDELDVSTPQAGFPELKFDKRSHLARDLKRSYRRMGERVASRVFDDPRGKRVVFDVDGHPGVGLEIPIK